MNYKPLVSIIVNCYNGQEFLRHALDSILEQTYDFWEVIFWDNRSSDKSASIFNSYSDNRFRYFLAPSHTNLSTARNLAIDNSRGELIAFLDCDDIWLPQKLDIQISQFLDNSIGFSCGAYYLQHEASSTKKLVSINRKSLDNVPRSLLENYFVCMPTLMIRRSLIPQNHCFNTNYHIIGDFDLSVRLSLISKLSYSFAPLSVCRKHPANESTRRRSLLFYELNEWFAASKPDSRLHSNLAESQFLDRLRYREFISGITLDITRDFCALLKSPISLKRRLKLFLLLLIPVHFRGNFSSSITDPHD